MHTVHTYILQGSPNCNPKVPASGSVGGCMYSAWMAAQDKGRKERSASEAAAGMDASRESAGKLVLAASQLPLEVMPIWYKLVPTSITYVLGGPMTGIACAQPL